MELNCNDPIFGDMTYKHGWSKNQNIKLFENIWNIKVLAKTYLEKPINEAEQNSYKSFMDNEIQFIEIVENQIKDYINSNIQELSQYWSGARRVKQAADLSQIVTPKTLLFKQDGSVIMLLDCVWDEENGIGVKLIPEIKIGSQDIFL
ncbi:DUF6985 domain-containing protein [Peptoanaerobacter stomatis]|uniref:DUF6985 domain-containing protein n=1 Tax=Peptoanaerobacter stomatis TaxID=796937 RepID=UPI003F9FD7E6